MRWDEIKWVPTASEYWERGDHPLLSDGGDSSKPGAVYLERASTCNESRPDVYFIGVLQDRAWEWSEPLNQLEAYCVVLELTRGGNDAAT